VTARVHSWVEGGAQDMVVGKVEEGSKMDLHTLTDIGVHHTWVVVGCLNYGVLWYRLIHPPCETSQVCPGRMVRVSGRQVVLCISNLIKHE
jgi:hypothetical protein